MEKKILIPSNFTKHAWNTLVYALNLYKSVPCTFYILNAYKIPTRISLNRNQNAELEAAKAESEKGLQKIMQGLNFRKENEKHTFETISRNKDLADAIQETVDTHKIDLILMVSRGENVSINAAFENEISEVIQKVEDCPFLVLPEQMQDLPETNREIVFPTNYKFPFKNKEVAALIDMANNLNASIRILYIDSDGRTLSKEQEQNKEMLKTYFAELDFSFHKLTQTTVTTGIHLFIESRESNFLALYKRKQGFFSKLFSQRFKEEIDFNPKVPVLILKELE
ncbi:universal stress protein [Salegentibacter salarius]|uniref:Universal stress protein n=1 Tax=Salegentibacter salarius TaxID=435906 RepID=A0A2N0U2I4_9FLAO|nr:universal stress protein [Salegentibacter salarius]OEY73759.1 universal stress protein [Salegentibacter salarius]PKD21220.1 universal stress protein [Salegentibacter salarius]SLJ93977.1 Universal stress protein family protein [Salegentibacter salarius]